MKTYYTIESVREQITEAGWRCLLESGMNDNWSRYPCSLESKCEDMGRQTCNALVAVLLNNPRCAIAVIEVIFIRQRHTGIIRAENRQLEKLIALGIVDRGRLKTITAGD